MNTANVLWIWRRELRDQLRDRRTLFMIAVLPILMYPLLGTSLFQLAQFMRETTGRVAVYGLEGLEGVEDLPPLIEDGQFAFSLFLNPLDADRLVVETHPLGEDPVSAAEQLITNGGADVGVVLPADFAARLAEVRRLTEDRDSDLPAPEIPKPTVLYQSSREASQVSGVRTDSVVRRWRDAIVRQNLRAGQIPAAATQPFEVTRIDIATQESRDALLWSKLLPFVVFLWALTGAFYPAIDLCAGEKERGTLETLLVSPARRSEIVGGKLLTVMTFSVFTALLNLASLGLTAKVLSGQLTGLVGAQLAIAPPPLSAIAWLVVAVVPIAALFSALSLACAAYAKSTKEGQYYFMPLFLAAMPLMLVPMSPGVELNLGNSFVPVMGLVLLLRAMIENQITAVAQFAAPVILSTAVCCWLAMKWAVSQFNQESVLFRESERFDLRDAVRAMRRNRGATPSAGAALACFAGILLMQNLVRSLTPPPVAGESGFGYFAGIMLASQLFCILAPALAIAGLLSRNLLATFLLDRPPRLGDLVAALGVAVFLHPAGQVLGRFIRELYPLSESVQGQLAGLGALMGDAPPIWVVLLLMAALPAVCEELAFRGVILAGLRKSLGSTGGVLMTAVLFGATHTVLQQSLAAAPVGALIGLIALRTGHLAPCIVFHAAYNSLQILSGLHAKDIRKVTESWAWGDTVFTEFGSGELGYTLLIAILGSIAAGFLLRGFGRGDRGNPQAAATLEPAH